MMGQSIGKKGKRPFDTILCSKSERRNSAKHLILFFDACDKSVSHFFALFLNLTFTIKLFHLRYYRLPTSTMVCFSRSTLFAVCMGVVGASSTCNAFIHPKTFGNNLIDTGRRNQFSKPSPPCELRSTPTDSTTSEELKVNDNSNKEIDTSSRATTTTSTSTTSISNKNDDKFENDGLFAWMQPYLDLFGFVEGNTVYYGPGVAVDPSNIPSEEEQARLRKEAVENMMNIGMGERERRRQGGEIATKVAIGYAIVSSIFLDDGSFEGHFVRLGLALVRLLFFLYCMF